MDSLVFLLGALVVIALATSVVVLRNREPKGLDHGMKEFQREMRALSPEARRAVMDRHLASKQRAEGTDGTKG